VTQGLLHRGATRILVEISRRKWGVTAVLMPSIVDRLGPLGALRWIAANMPKYEASLVEMGPVRAHLMCMLASLLNGCPYCAYAHGRAFELYYFEKFKRLFPLDEHRLIGLSELTDDEQRAELARALDAADLHDEIALFDRLYALKLLGEEPRPEDHHIVHAIKMFDVLNYCAIDSQAAVDEAHDRVNMDTDLKRRYAAARMAEQRARESSATS
jgi:hypothetical protein